MLASWQSAKISLSSPLLPLPPILHPLVECVLAGGEVRGVVGAEGGVRGEEVTGGPSAVGGMAAEGAVAGPSLSSKGRSPLLIMIGPAVTPRSIATLLNPIGAKSGGEHDILKLAPGAGLLFLFFPSLL